MKKVLILGAGRGQMPIFGIAQKLGCDVVFVTPEGDYPGLNKAKVRFADVRDYKAVLKIATEEKVDAIITDQLDAGIYSAAYASEELGLIGIGKEIAIKFTNKYEMRKAAEEAGVAVPKYFAVKSIEEIRLIADKIMFPSMIKPDDNASSRGVFLVENIDELIKHFEISQKYSTRGIVLIERFVKGKEYVVESFTRDNLVTPLIVGHRDYFDIPKLFIPKATVFIDASSTKLSYVEKKVLEANNKLIKSFGLPFGITHGEFIYSEEEDEVYLVEIAARGGGEFISAVLIPLACGVRANELYVRHVLGMDYSLPDERLCKSSAYFSYLLPEGNITSINGIDECRKIPGAYNLMFDNIELGMKIAPICDKASRKGPLLVEAENKEGCYLVLEQIKKALNIEVTNENGLVNGIIW